MRLIDADVLPKYTGYALSADEVAKAVENAPTIEAEPVRRGKWIEEPGGFMCSVCHDAWSEENEEMIKNWNYCPWCGAQMEELE